jgi:hypothetical protein
MSAFVVLLALPALSDVEGQGEPSLPVQLASRHYDLQTSAEREQGQELLDFMELVHQTYTALLKPENPREVEKRRFTILLHRDMAEYVRGGGPPGSGAYYDPRSGRLVGWYDEVFMRPFFAHEGMHQFTDATSKNFQAFPMWFTEGIADCLGNGEVRGGKLYMCVKSGIIARMRLQTVQAAVRANAAVPLARLLTLNRDVFMRNSELCYAQSWSFCHFLLTYPKEEDRSSQIPDGRYRKNLAGYYEAVRSGKHGSAEAFALAFKGIPLEDLEEAWKRYVLALDAGRFMGIAGRELQENESEGLPIEAGYAGLLLEQVLPDGVAGKAGIRPGDVIVRFNGKRLPRRDAMNRLRVFMQDVPTGRPVKVAVLREGKEIEFACTWDAARK